MRTSIEALRKIATKPLVDDKAKIDDLAKKLKALLSPIEQSLTNKLNVIDVQKAEEERKRILEVERLQKRTTDRVRDLLANGFYGPTPLSETEPEMSYKSIPGDEHISEPMCVLHQAIDKWEDGLYEPYLAKAKQRMVAIKAYKDKQQALIDALKVKPEPEPEVTVGVDPYKTNTQENQSEPAILRVVHPPVVTPGGIEALRKSISVSEIDVTSIEGKLLLAALAIITTEVRTSLTPDQVLSELEDLAVDMDLL